MMKGSNLKIVISNGGFKFHLAPAAAELADMKLLDAFITAGYPTDTFKRLFNKNTSQAAIKRLFDREEAIPTQLIHAQWPAEFMIQSGIRIARLFKSNLSDYSENLAMKWYANSAKKIIKESKANIYHYRAGYGHQSVEVAKKKGMITICDHSIAHPALIDHLIKNKGEYPSSKNQLHINSYWNDILQDISQADYVLVNSEFVKDTMVFMGTPKEKIHVIYLGVDDSFLKNIPIRQKKSETTSSRPLRLLYAGGIIQRKGFETLKQALENIAQENWELDIAGGGDVSFMQSMQEFFKHTKVNYLGNLSRENLAKTMSNADVFIFPSFAEGSARVVFEALSAGCYVITTPNSGSIVEDGVHGNLIKPGSSENLVNAITWCISNQEQVEACCHKNQQLIFSQYRQQDYGEKLHSFYKLISHLS